MRLLITAGHRLGFAFTVIRDHPLNILRVTRNGAGFVFRMWPGLITFRKRHDSDALINKAAQKPLLVHAGLPVPRLQAVLSSVEELRSAKVDFPCVVKPCIGRYSRGVVTHVRTPATLRQAVMRVARPARDVLIEEHVDGAHYRVLCVGGRFAGCVERRPPRVVGDGVQTIAALVEQRNRAPERQDPDPLGSLLHPIAIDAASAGFLRQQGYTPDRVPAAGVTVRLSRRIIGSVGADFIDVSGRIHRETVRLCEAFASRHSLFMAGFDLITPRIDTSVRRVGAFNEVNVQEVDISCIERCNMGRQLPVSRYIWERVPFAKVATPAYPPY